MRSSYHEGPIRWYRGGVSTTTRPATVSPSSTGDGALLRGLTPDLATPAFFRFRALPSSDRVVITNVEGNWLVLGREDFRAFVSGNVAEGSDLFARLRERNFLRAHHDPAAARARIERRRMHLDRGPILHMMIVTLRCNETCVYCHASRAEMDAVHTDMTPEVADASVDLAFQTTSPSLTIEFQGGEPLVNFPIVKRIVERGQQRSKETGKTVEFTMVSNLALMDEEKLAFLLANRVQICTSIDGPEDLHDRQRKLPLAPGETGSPSAFRAATGWIRRINEAYVAAGLDPHLYHVEALLTTTRASLERWKEVVDTFASLGVRSIFLRPIDPFGFAEKTAKVVEYPRGDYLAYYRQATDYVLELNRSGTQMLERYAAIFLTKILAGEDPNFLDIRSPEGAGIGALAYNYDGKVFASDEGRMLHERGDDAFLLAADVRTARYRDVVGHPTVRATILASNLDGQPDCVDCPYNPYCGTQTAHNHKTLGSIFGRMRESHVCQVHKGIQDYLFEKLATADEPTLDVLRRWTTIRPREHFLQRPE
jgi:His-Xaa-Ser system radical SAM maturase HxsB